MTRFIKTGGLILVCACGARAGAQPALSTDKAVYVVGERVKAAFSGAPQSGTDWVGIYPASQSSNMGSTYWRYTNGTQQAGGGPAAGTLTFLPMSLPPGAYHARLFFSNNYTLRAQAAFTIVSPAPPPAPPPPDTLTVMSFNIWVNATNGPGGVPEVARAIRDVKADLIGLQECSAATLDAILAQLHADPYYANATGSATASVISRFPIVATYSAGLLGYGVRVRLPSGVEARLFNAHLQPYPYGPYTARDGGSDQQILNDELASRAAQAQAILTQLVDNPANAPELPTFFTGDHNAPSHLDWIDANRDQNFGRVIIWPASKRITDAGFLDSYRVVHPDPIAERGFTWTSGAPRDTLDHNDVHDRIDYVYYRPSRGLRMTPVAAATMDRTPWPSDHRAVYASFRLAPNYGANLIVNPGGDAINVAGTEQTSTSRAFNVTDTATMFGWTVSGSPANNNAPTTYRYDSAPAEDYPLLSEGPRDPDGNPTGRRNFFFGGFNSGSLGASSAYQDIRADAFVADIGAGSVRFGLSGWIGGYYDQTDTVTISAIFRDANGAELGRGAVGPMTPAERNNSRNFFFRAASGCGAVPAGTRSVRVRMDWAGSGPSLDGYADNLSLSLRLAWDINGDGATDDADLSLVLLPQGKCSGEPGFDCRADINADGCVDDADLGLVLAHQGE